MSGSDLALASGVLWLADSDLDTQATWRLGAYVLQRRMLTGIWIAMWGLGRPGGWGPSLFSGVCVPAYAGMVQVPIGTCVAA